MPFDEAASPCNEAAADRLRVSLQAAIAQPEHFGAAFYRRLFELAPALRRLFPHDLQHQQLKLVQSLSVVVLGLERWDAVEEELRRLGARHVHYGTEPQHFATVGEALLETLAELNPVGLDGELRRSWQALYGRIVAAMLVGAAGESVQARQRSEAG